MNDDTAILSALPAGQLPDADPEDERHDGLAEELAHAAPKRWWYRGTVVLAGLVLLGGGFVGGLQVQKNWGATTPASGFAGFNAGGAAGGGAGRYGGGGGTGRGGAGAYGFPGGAGTQGGATGGQAAPSAASLGTTGTVKLVDGSTIYVQTSDGNVVTVNTNGKTAVSAATKSTLKGVKAGQKVTVQGAAGSDGTVTATSVTTQK